MSHPGWRRLLGATCPSPTRGFARKQRRSAKSPWLKRHQGGQASVELALVLPLVVSLLLVILEAGLIARDQVMVVHAAREAARVAAVDPSPAAAVAAAQGSSGLGDLEVRVGSRGAAGSRVTVTVRFHEPGRVPLLSAITSRLVLEASATMRVEGDAP